MVTKARLNKPVTDKQVSSFYVEFYDLEGNEDNILGRGVLSFERPLIRFRTFETRHKETYRSDTANMNFEPTNIRFRDDSENIIQKILYNQMYKQAGKELGGMSNPLLFEKSKFNVKFTAYNQESQPVEQFELKRCALVSITHSEAVYSDENRRNEITVMVSYDTVDFNLDL